MSIIKGYLNIEGSPLSGTNPLPQFRDRCHDKAPQDNGTLLPEELAYFGYESAFRVLPYTVQDRYGREKRPMKLASIVLENEYLRAEFLPEYGGRLYSLQDKSNGQELLYRNPVMQPANLAIRNAWFSGGIEWNIAQLGHTFSTCDDVFFAKVSDPGKEEFLRMYDYERTRGLVWQIDFHLPKEAHVLAAHVTVINDRKSAVPMYWWTNIAAKEEPGCRVFSGTSEVIYIEPKSQAEGAQHRFGHGRLPYIPALPEQDASYPLHFNYSNEYFFQNPATEESPWEAISYPDGSVFFERSTQPLRIRKMFCWGNHSGGRNWRDYLAREREGDYVEIQAGLAPTQLHGMEMPGNSRIEFTQVFGSLTVAPGSAEQTSYEASRMCLARAVEEALPAHLVTKADRCLCRCADLPCTEILHNGHGWGALENLRRAQVQEEPLPGSCLFPADSLSCEQDYWVRLLHTQAPKLSDEQDGTLDSKDSAPLPELGADELPLSWMTDLNYLPHLTQYYNDHPDSVTALLHMGTILYENGDFKEAVRLWELAAEHRPLPILYRNLSFAARQDKDIRRAAAYIEQIPRETYINLDYAYLQEYLTLLAEDGDWDRLFQYYQTLPDSLKEQERLCLLACEAALHRKDWAFLEAAFQKEYASIREGETKIIDIWLAYAKEKDIPLSQLPHNLDLRMF